MPQKFKWPSWPQWKQLPKLLTRREFYTVLALLAAVILSGTGWIWYWYVQSTVVIPRSGGNYSEALAGEPQFINPILISTNDVDRDLSVLIYSGLMKYDVESNLAPDLAEKYEVSEDGLTYVFYLKKDVKWHDGEPFNADDVLFTVNAILNPDYGSPLRLSWQGISAEKRDDYIVAFKLPKPHFQFLDKTTLGILPRHIWSAVDPKNINLADANLKPIGTGPFVFNKFAKDKLGNIISFSLNTNENYYNGKPYIATVELYFYEDENAALDAYKNGETLGLSYVSPKNRDLAETYNTEIHKLKIPKYFSVFFNQSRNKALADKNVRAALLYAADKKEIISAIFKNNAVPVDSPVLPWLSAYNDNVKKYEFSKETAVKILEDNGWKDKNNDGIREKTVGTDKEPTNLEITLTTSDFADHVQAGEILKKQWGAIGAKVNLENYVIDELKQKIIKQRKYDALLFGEVLSQNPDPYVFWHSSQKKDPGLNLSAYDDKTADQLLETARQAKNSGENGAALKKFQEIIMDDAPALFLYSPDYLYAVSKKVKNISVQNINVPSRRFSGIEKWYIETQRIKK